MSKVRSDPFIYRSRLNRKINRNFEVFTPTDFLAATTQYIPDKGAQMVRYYGWYSNKIRAQRHRTETGGAASTPLRPPSTPPPPAKLPSKKWRDLIQQVWHTDPLICPQCKRSMRVIVVRPAGSGGKNPPPPRPVERHAATRTGAPPDADVGP